MRKSKKPRLRKTFGFHIRVYVISLFVGITVFALVSFFLKPDTPCANSKTCTSDLSESIQNGAAGTFQGRKILPPQIDLAFDNSQFSVLGTNVPSSKKHIYVDLSTQTLYAYQGNTQVMKALIASGKWGRTPIGNFYIWEKLRSTRMAGGSGDDAYDLPNVPYVMYFYHDFGLHGAYWHDNFGHTMSHGCVNMRPIDARDLYNWVDGPENGQHGTPVSICNSFTGPNTCMQENPINL